FCSHIASISHRPMDSAQQAEICLLCEVPTSEIRLGINCCRKCSVFYKRTLSNKRSLRCNNNNGECVLKDPKTTCRKCRFDRIVVVVASCSEEMKDVVIQSRCDAEDTVIAQSMSFLDHETCFSDCATNRETPSLNRMKVAYGLLCMMRKNGEMGT
ncbi:hypothetical protein PENTCL1PPCAC_14908, partial [Pristionchus entomophagus]